MCVAVADFVSSQRCCLLNVVSSTEGWLLAPAPFYRLCPHYIGHDFYLPAKPKGDRHFLSTQYESSFWIWRRNVKPLTSGVILHYFPPVPPFSASQFRVWISRPRPASALFPCVNSADSQSGEVGGGLGSPLAGISPKKEIRFFWWFLHSYITSGPFYCWYFLLLKLQIFLCYLSFQVMAILCCVAKNSLRGTTAYLSRQCS